MPAPAVDVGEQPAGLAFQRYDRQVRGAVFRPDLVRGENLAARALVLPAFGRFPLDRLFVVRGGRKRDRAEEVLELVGVLVHHVFRPHKLEEPGALAVLENGDAQAEHRRFDARRLVVLDVVARPAAQGRAGDRRAQQQQPQASDER